MLDLSPSSSAVHAASISVDSTADNLVAGDGNCTLREAIRNANNDSDSTGGDCAAGSGSDTIHVPVGTYVLSIAGTDENSSATGDLDIRGSVTIVGAGAVNTIIDGAGLDHVFHVVSAISNIVEIANLTIENGAATEGGGVFNFATLTISNSVIRNNTAVTGGGGIRNAGSLTIINSTVSNNVSGSNGGGLISYRTPTNSLYVSGSTFSRNSAGNVGGAFSKQSEPATIINSTFSGNSAGGHGGAFGTLGPVTLDHVTITGNSSGAQDSSAIASSTGELVLKNTLVAGNSADCTGSRFTSSGYNLIGQIRFCQILGDTTGNLFELYPFILDPFLGPLQNNGGSTATHALLAGSPAIGTGSPDCPPPAVDQRGLARPQGAVCDIGSFEATVDGDDDGIPDDEDNCPESANADQADNDGDGDGDVCDGDDDNDGVLDGDDAFPHDPTESADTDGDGTGNNADTDDDGDGQSDADEMACGSDPLTAASLAPDNDDDHVPDCVDADDDNDSVPDDEDNCPDTSNADQGDYDGDGDGDACDADDDNDGVLDGDDAYPHGSLDSAVVIDGCDAGVANHVFADGSSFNDLIGACAAGAANHGAFVSCVTQLANGWKNAGLITGAEKGRITRCAAGADIP